MEKRFKNRIIILLVFALVFFSLLSVNCSIGDDESLDTQLDPQIEELAHITDTGGDTFKSFIRNNLLYVLDIVGGFKIYNIEDPTNPTLIGSFDDGNYSYEMHIVDNLLYLANNDQGLEIYDVSEPTAPVKLGTIGDDGNGTIDAVYVDNGLAYVAEWHGGYYGYGIMQIFDVTTPSAPKKVGEYYDEDNRFFNFVVRDKICFASCLDGGFKILDVTDSANVTEISKYKDINCYTWSSLVAEDIAYIANGPHGLEILNISVIESPEKIGRYDTIQFAFCVEVVDTIAFLVEDETGLKILDISDNQNITKLNEFATEDITHVSVQDDLLSITMHEYGLKILKITWLYETRSASSTAFLGLVLLIVSQLWKKKKKV